MSYLPAPKFSAPKTFKRGNVKPKGGNVLDTSKPSAVHALFSVFVMLFFIQII